MNRPPGDGFGFALEALFASRISRELRGKNFYRDGAVEPCVPRTVHLAHPARAERRDDLMRPPVLSRL
ncbi:MAG: hypothetical protein DMG38_18465 [Acidobacteria bacterium]|nr:MAG: hypothetical protein DMG38_18465 [Acidobacteriota bacterium]